MIIEHKYSLYPTINETVSFTIPYGYTLWMQNDDMSGFTIQEIFGGTWIGKVPEEEIISDELNGLNINGVDLIFTSSSLKIISDLINGISKKTNVASIVNNGRLQLASLNGQEITLKNLTDEIDNLSILGLPDIIPGSEVIVQNATYGSAAVKENIDGYGEVVIDEQTIKYQMYIEKDDSVLLYNVKGTVRAWAEYINKYNLTYDYWDSRKEYKKGDIVLYNYKYYEAQEDLPQLNEFNEYYIRPILKGTEFTGTTFEIQTLNKDYIILNNKIMFTKQPENGSIIRIENKPVMSKIIIEPYIQTNETKISKILLNGPLYDNALI